MNDLLSRPFICAEVKERGNKVFVQSGDIGEDRECAFQPIIGRLIDSAANLPLARIYPSGKFAVALFTFTPFLSSSVILEAFHL